MKDIFENWNSFQINEGILEKETTEISREIVKRFKKWAGAGTIHQSRMPYHWIDVSRDIPDSLKDVADLHAILVKVLPIDLKAKGIPHGRRTRSKVRFRG